MLKQHGTHMIQSYVWFQPSTGDLGICPLQIRRVAVCSRENGRSQTPTAQESQSWAGQDRLPHYLRKLQCSLFCHQQSHCPKKILLGADESRRATPAPGKEHQQSGHLVAQLDGARQVLERGMALPEACVVQQEDVAHWSWLTTLGPLCLGLRR